LHDRFVFNILHLASVVSLLHERKRSSAMRQKLFFLPLVLVVFFLPVIAAANDAAKLNLDDLANVDNGEGAEVDEDDADGETPSEEKIVLEEMDKEVLEEWQAKGIIGETGMSELTTETNADRKRNAGKGYLPMLEHSKLLSTDALKSKLGGKQKAASAWKYSYNAKDFDFPIVYNQQVESWIDFYSGRGKKHFAIYLERASKYLPMIRQILKEEGVPQDLAYLPLIESGFALHAKSRARAVGMWQFIKGTGKICGLRIAKDIDERRDFELSTRAAAKHLKWLFDRFGDWYLALGGYNAGPVRIDRAVDKYGARDFWQISQYNHLRMETRLYVPKFIAALIIAHDPEKYGLRSVEDNPIKYDEIKLEGPATFSAIAKASNSDDETIHDLNPMFMGKRVPKDGVIYTVRIPKGRAAVFAEKWENMNNNDKMKVVESKKKEAKKVAKKEPASAKDAKSKNERPGVYIIEKYTVRFGDNLEKISKYYGCSVKRLIELNDMLDPDSLQPGQTLKIERFLPDPNYSMDEKGKSVLKKARAEMGKKDPFKGMRADKYQKGQKSYTVQKGDSLEEIAAKYGVKKDEIIKKNDKLKSMPLKVGQKIIIK